MRALEFITGHVIYNLGYTYKFQLKTPQIRCRLKALWLVLLGFLKCSYYCTMMFSKYLVKICFKNNFSSLWNVWMTWTVTFVSLPITALVMDTTNWPKLDFFLFTWHSAILLCITQDIGKKLSSTDVECFKSQCSGKKILRHLTFFCRHWIIKNQSQLFSKYSFLTCQQQAPWQQLT